MRIGGVYLPDGQYVELGDWREEALFSTIDLSKENDMHVIDGMRVMVKREEVLAKLHFNLEKHKETVKAAQAGYCRLALEAIAAKTRELQEGRPAALNFNLPVPADHSEVYVVAIAMLSAHTVETIELDSDQFQSLMMNEWSWTRQFEAISMPYTGRG